MSWERLAGKRLAGEYIWSLRRRKVRVSENGQRSRSDIVRGWRYRTLAVDGRVALGNRDGIVLRLYESAAGRGTR